jgi:hypothetical protein
MSLLILVLNYILAWTSARIVARSWLDAKAAGRGTMLLCWAGATLAALGFTWCYLTLALVGAHSFGLIVASWVHVVADVGGMVLASLGCGAALLLLISFRLRVVRERVFHDAGDEQWKRYYGAALSGIQRVTGRDNETSDANDSGTMIVLFALLATTAILGVVQTYLMIRAGIAETARQIAADHQMVCRA